MDAAGLEELRKEKAAKKSAGGLQKPYKCSALLADFVGEPSISRYSLSQSPNAASAIAHTRTRRDVFPLTGCPYIAIYKTDTFFFIVPGPP
jgi:hypothetical protein|tara:strand:- start:4197 stop:4469 length:273 start_codon:yes stop_codon:yes gene_type:complete